MTKNSFQKEVLNVYLNQNLLWLEKLFQFFFYFQIRR